MLSGKELKTRRETLKMTQQQIADLLCIGQNTVSRIETGLNDKLSLHIAYNGLLNELEQSFIDTIEDAIDYCIPIPQSDLELYEKLKEGANNGKKEG